MSNFVLSYSQNDVYFNTANCSKLTNETEKTNCEKAKVLQQTLDNYSASKTKMQDVNKAYNREVLFTVNVMVGLGLLSAYFYGVHRAGV